MLTNWQVAFMVFCTFILFSGGLITVGILQVVDAPADYIRLAAAAVLSGLFGAIGFLVGSGDRR